MKGFVPTPAATVRLMVEKLFRDTRPRTGTWLLDPGCGDGEFIAGVIDYCTERDWELPRIVGVELDPERAARAARRFCRVAEVEIRREDFLLKTIGSFDYIVGNPPYVPITGLNLAEREAYRGRFASARGRFDLYLLFFEQALRVLTPEGRLVFITPEKYLYVETSRPLRELMIGHAVEELDFLAETTFSERVTYPLITTLVRSERRPSTRIARRDGSCTRARFASSDSWMPVLQGQGSVAGDATLADVSLRSSCGVATGADPVFVINEQDLTPELKRFAHPTISGRQILPSGVLRRDSCMLAPYDETGRLLAESALGPMGTFLREPARRAQLAGRTCVGRKPWYAFHDNMPLGDLLRPKLLCKDITQRPFFVLDVDGRIVPRHSVYYIVPSDPSELLPLAEYLNSEVSVAWLRANCQRAANGFLRMQSNVLKRLPLPVRFAPSAAAMRATAVSQAARPA